MLALERTGLVTTHVEGLAADYAETLRYWIERFEEHYEDAVRIAGIERARIWRLYLRAARQGFNRLGVGLPGARAATGIVPRSDVRARQIETIAERVDEQQARFNVQVVLEAVDFQHYGDGLAHALSLLRMFASARDDTPDAWLMGPFLEAA